MGKFRQKFGQKGFDEKEYQSYFHQHQSEYIRKKLRIIKLYHEKMETNANFQRPKCPYSKYQ